MKKIIFILMLLPTLLLSQEDWDYRFNVGYNYNLTNEIDIFNLNLDINVNRSKWYLSFGVGADSYRNIEAIIANVSTRYRVYDGMYFGTVMLLGNTKNSPFAALVLEPRVRLNKHLDISIQGGYEAYKKSPYMGIIINLNILQNRI